VCIALLPLQLLLPFKLGCHLHVASINITALPPRLRLLLTLLLVHHTRLAAMNVTLMPPSTLLLRSCRSSGLGAVSHPTSGGAADGQQPAAAATAIAHELMLGRCQCQNMVCMHACTKRHAARILLSVHKLPGGHYTPSQSLWLVKALSGQ
jgi:hypothetical protein